MSKKITLLLSVLMLVSVTTSLNRQPLTIEAATDSPPTQETIKFLNIAYYPPASDPTKLDYATTGMTNISIATIRQKVQEMTAGTIRALQEGSRYRKYRFPSSPAYLSYVQANTPTIEHLETMKLSTFPVIDREHQTTPGFYPDYRSILERENICNWVDTRGVRQVWLWGYHHGDLVPAESNMSVGTNSQAYFASSIMPDKSYLDISNSTRVNDLPQCQNTYTLFNYNYQREVGEALEDHAHQFESLFDGLDWIDQMFLHRHDGLLFERRAGDMNADDLIEQPGCGSVHYPPNGVKDYDWYNSTPIATDCMDWKPDGSGAKSVVNCSTWSADPTCKNDGGVAYKIWWMQGFPGRSNGLTYNGLPVRNWWEAVADLDRVLAARYGLVAPTSYDNSFDEAIYSGTDYRCEIEGVIGKIVTQSGSYQGVAERQVVLKSGDSYLSSRTDSSGQFTFDLAAVDQEFTANHTQDQIVVTPLTFFVMPPGADIAAGDLEDSITNPTTDLRPWPIRATQDNLSLQGEVETGYALSVTNLCASPAYNETGKQLDLTKPDSGGSLQIPAVNGNIKLRNLQDTFASSDHVAERYVLRIQNGGESTETVFPVTADSITEAVSYDSLQQLQVWSFDSASKTILTLHSTKSSKPYHLAIAETPEDNLGTFASLYPILTQNTLLAYTLNDVTAFTNAVNSKGVIFDVDLNKLPQPVLSIKGQVFFDPTTASESEPSADELSVVKLLENPDLVLNAQKDKVDLVVDETRIATSSIAISGFETLSFPISAVGKIGVYVNNGESRCYPVISYAWIDSFTEIITDPTEINASPKLLTLDGSEWIEPLAASKQLVLLVGKESTLDCFTGLADERLTSGGTTTGVAPADGSGSGAGSTNPVTPIASSSGTPQALSSDWVKAAFGDAAVRTAIKYNTYGIHLLVEQGALPDDIDNEACQVTGSWGFVKGLWYPLSKDTAAPQDFAVGFVNEAIRMNMIPVMRVATRWIEPGMVRPDQGELPPAHLASLIKQLADARTDPKVPLLIEAFNEPNLGWDWATEAGAGTETAASYAQYMVELHTALKAAFGGDHTASLVYLVTAGLAPGGNTDGVTTPEAYIEKMMAVEGFTTSFDVWGSQGKLSNSEAANVQPLPADCTDTAAKDPFHVCQYKNEVALLGDRAATVPVFIIEAGYAKGVALPGGYTTGSIPGLDSIEDARAKMTIHAAEVWRADPQVMGVTFWQLADPHNRYNNWDWAYREYNDDATLRSEEIQPVYTAVSQYLGGLGINNTMCTETNNKGGEWQSGSGSSTTTTGQSAVQNGSTNLAGQGATNADGTPIVHIAVPQSATRTGVGITTDAATTHLLAWKADKNQYEIHTTVRSGQVYALPKDNRYILAATTVANSVTPSDYTFFALPDSEMKTLWVEVEGTTISLKLKPRDTSGFEPIEAIECERCVIGVSGSEPSDSIVDPVEESTNPLRWIYAAPAAKITEWINANPIIKLAITGLSSTTIEVWAERISANMPALINSLPADVIEALELVNENDWDGVFGVMRDQFDVVWPRIKELMDTFSAPQIQIVGGVDMVPSPTAAGLPWFRAAHAVNTTAPVGYAVIEFIGAFQTFVALADAEGDFNISLPPADYEVLVKAPGYKTLSGQWTAEAGGHFVGSFQLEPGADEESGGTFAINAALPLSRFGINEDGQFALQPNPELAFVYEYRVNASSYQSLSFDYRYLTEKAEGGDLEFEVLLLDGTKSHVLFDPGKLTDGTDWLASGPDNGKSDIGFTPEGTLNLAQFLGQDLTFRFVVRLAEGATFATSSSLANAMELRRLEFRSTDQVTTIGYDTNESGREVISLWHPNHTETYLSDNPSQVGTTAITRTLHWMHTNYGWPAPDGTLYQGEIEELESLESCGETYESVLSLRPTSRSEPSYIDLNFTEAAGSALESIDFAAGGECEGSGSTDLTIFAIVLGDQDEILSIEEVLWTGESIKAWSEQSLSLRDYQQKKLVLRIQASGRSEFETFDKAYIAGLTFKHGSLNTIAATVLPLASIFFTVLPILAIGLSVGGLVLLVILKRK